MFSMSYWGVITVHWWFYSVYTQCFPSSFKNSCYYLFIYSGYLCQMIWNCICILNGGKLDLLLLLFGFSVFQLLMCSCQSKVTWSWQILVSQVSWRTLRSRGTRLWVRLSGWPQRSSSSQPTTSRWGQETNWVADLNQKNLYASQLKVETENKFSNHINEFFCFAFCLFLPNRLISGL